MITNKLSDLGYSLYNYETDKHRKTIITFFATEKF